VTHTLCVATQLNHRSMKVAPDKRWTSGHGCVPIKLNSGCQNLKVTWVLQVMKNDSSSDYCQPFNINGKKYPKFNGQTKNSGLALSEFADIWNLRELVLPPAVSVRGQTGCFLWAPSYHTKEGVWTRPMLPGVFITSHMQLLKCKCELIKKNNSVLRWH